MVGQCCTALRATPPYEPLRRLEEFTNGAMQSPARLALGAALLATRADTALGVGRSSRFPTAIA